MSIAIATTWEDRMHDLGNISPSRIRTEPAPGTATIEDVTRLRDTERRLYELVDRTLVEKSMGWQESLLGGVLLQWLNNYLDGQRLLEIEGPWQYKGTYTGTEEREPGELYLNWSRLERPKPLPRKCSNFSLNHQKLEAQASDTFFSAGVMRRSMMKPRNSGNIKL